MINKATDQINSELKKTGFEYAIQELENKLSERNRQSYFDEQQERGYREAINDLRDAYVDEYRQGWINENASDLEEKFVDYLRLYGHNMLANRVDKFGLSSESYEKFAQFCHDSFNEYYSITDIDYADVRYKRIVSYEEDMIDQERIEKIYAHAE